MTPSEENGDPYSSRAKDEMMDVVLLLPVQESKQRYHSIKVVEAGVDQLSNFIRGHHHFRARQSRLFSCFLFVHVQLLYQFGLRVSAARATRAAPYITNSGRRAGYSASGLLRKGSRQ